MEPVLDHAPCGYLSLTDDGTMLEVNTTLASMLGYRRLELEGWHLQKILAPGGRIFYQTHAFPLLKLHGMVEELYLPLRTRDGADVPMLLNGARSEREGRAVIDCVFMRMRQRHAFEDQLLQARRLAEQASAAKAKFLSMMSHDLRTPLTTISGYASLMAAETWGPLNEEQSQAMREIRDAGGELLRMINDILAFAQVESGRFAVRPVELAVGASLERAVKLVRLHAEEAGLSLQIEACDDGLAVYADPDRLQQILLNLLTNAFKFTRRGGRVSVTCAPAGPRVRIDVRDTGIGIPRDQLARIFDAFVQLDQEPRDPTQRGVGLGLAISRDLARAMDGELTADSVPGEGSVFTIELPAAGVPAAAR